jgi:hypothetical protein
MRTISSRNRTLTSAEPVQLQGGTALRRTCGHITAQSNRNRIGTYLERTAPEGWNSESKFPNTYSFGEEIDTVSGAFQDSKYTSGNKCVVPARRGCWVPFRV